MNKKGSMQVYTKITSILVILLLVFTTGFSNLPVGVLAQETPTPVETQTPTEEPAPSPTQEEDLPQPTPTLEETEAPQPTPTPEETEAPPPDENAAPTIELLQPSENITVTQGESITVEWVDEDPDDNAIITLALDTDDIPDNNEGHVLLIQDIEEDLDEEGDQYLLDTTEIASGSYYVWGMISDGVNPEVYTLAQSRSIHTGAWSDRDY
jgi:hypothetical protein